jgi:hypothetical protein
MAHAPQIASYRSIIEVVTRDISHTLNDQAPRSTLSRAAALLAGAGIACDYEACAQILYTAQAAARSSGHRQRCRRDHAGKIVSVPLFFRHLQAQLGGTNNPAWYPDPSERSGKGRGFAPARVPTPVGNWQKQRTRQDKAMGATCGGRDTIVAERTSDAAATQLSKRGEIDNALCTSPSYTADAAVSRSGTAPSRERSHRTSASPALHTLWHGVQERLQASVSRFQFESWIRGTVLTQDMDGDLVVVARTSASAEALSMRYRDLIVDGLSKESRNHFSHDTLGRLRFVVNLSPLEPDPLLLWDDQYRGHESDVAV